MQCEHASHTISLASVKQTRGNYCVSVLYRGLNEALSVGKCAALTFGVGHAESSNWKNKEHKYYLLSVHLRTLNQLH